MADRRQILELLSDPFRELPTDTGVSGSWPPAFVLFAVLRQLPTWRRWGRPSLERWCVRGYVDDSPTSRPSSLEYIVSLGGKDCYIKAAGDALQTKWLALRRSDPCHAFTHNAAQAAFSLWIDLPRLVHGQELGATVAAWKEHAVADHNEALTCVLSPKMFHAYVELQACFHRLYLDKGHGETLCAWRESTGALCPRKRRWDTAFCKEHARLAAPPSCLRCA